MSRKIGIVIPAYNESGNLYLLIGKIFTIIPQAKIVIVDDSNPEENEKMKKSLLVLKSSQKKKITILSRLNKQGRGNAVISGFKEILKNKDIQYCFEMDADLAHNPKDFHKFLQAMNSHNTDVVIGSRYLIKSKIIKWPLWRLVLSKIINNFIKVWLTVEISDYTNGFRLYNRRAISFLTKTELREKGFIALSEVAYKLKNNKFNIIEVPIEFTDRKRGKSSADFKEFSSALIGIMRIKMQKYH